MILKQFLTRVASLIYRPNSLPKLKSNRKNNLFYGMNKCQNKNWYCFDDANKKYATPKDQLFALKEATTDEETKKILPTIPDNFFESFDFKYLKDYTRTKDSPSCCENNSNRLLTPPALARNNTRHNTTNTISTCPATNAITLKLPSTTYAPTTPWINKQSNLSLVPIKHTNDTQAT